MSDIFISYAREDLDQAKLLASALEKQGWSVFWDRSSLLAGQDLDEVIEQEIESAACVIVGWSSVSIKSDWVRGEATIAREKRTLIPVLFQQVTPPIAFRSLHTENFNNWDGKDNSSEFLKLKKAVERLAGPSKNQISVSAATDLHSKKNREPEPAFAEITEQPLSTVILKPVTKPSPVIVPEMVTIPAGSFMMGSEAWDKTKPFHKVTIAKPFAIGKYPVTFAEYDAYAETAGIPKPRDQGWGRDRRPVIHVSWREAVLFTRWLTKQTGKRYRLPSEAEWEYAARGGTTTEYYWYDKDPKDFAWFSDNSGAKTHPVGEKSSNTFELYDTSGNIAEWVQDCWHNDFKSAPIDASVWEKLNDGDCTLRVLRGGSFRHKLWFLRTSYRSGRNPDYHDNNVGFRLAQDLD